MLLFKQEEHISLCRGHREYSILIGWMMCIILIKPYRIDLASLQSNHLSSSGRWLLINSICIWNKFTPFSRVFLEHQLWILTWQTSLQPWIPSADIPPGTDRGQNTTSILNCSSSSLMCTNRNNMSSTCRNSFLLSGTLYYSEKNITTCWYLDL